VDAPSVPDAGAAALTGLVDDTAADIATIADTARTPRRRIRSG
jgi:hypothetical protein